MSRDRKPEKPVLNRQSGKFTIFDIKDALITLCRAGLEDESNPFRTPGD
jgi:hypothetical protein